MSVEATRGPSLVFSSDVAGVLRGPEWAHNLYDQAGFADYGMEIIAFFRGMGSLYFASHGVELPFDISGAHGKMGAVPSMDKHAPGGLDYLKVKALDMTLPHLHPWFGVQLDRIGKNMGHPIYYNVHHELFAYSTGLLEHYLERFINFEHAYLAVENGPSTDGMRLTEEVITRFKDSGLEHVVGTHDVLHASLVLTDRSDEVCEIAKVWDQVLAGITDNTKQVHLSVGEEFGFRIMDLLKERKMFEALAATVKDKDLRVIIENQHGAFGVNEKEEVERMKWIGAGLVAVGLIGENHFSA